MNTLNKLNKSPYTWWQTKSQTVKNVSMQMSQMELIWEIIPTWIFSPSFLLKSLLIYQHPLIY